MRKPPLRTAANGCAKCFTNSRHGVEHEAKLLRHRSTLLHQSRIPPIGLGALPRHFPDAPFPAQRTALGTVGLGLGESPTHHERGFSLPVEIRYEAGRVAGLGEKAETPARIPEHKGISQACFRPQTLTNHSEFAQMRTSRKQHRACYTMDERWFWRWACMGVIRQNGKAHTIKFRLPYRELFDQLVLSAALDGRYRGSGEIVINRKDGLGKWLKTTKSTAQSDKLNGLFVRGVAVSSSAKVFNRKDGSGKIVCIRHELALQPGMAVFEEYPELGKVKLDGDNVIEFHRLPEMQQVTLKVLRWAEQDKRMVIKEAIVVIGDMMNWVRGQAAGMAGVARFYCRP